MGYTKLFSSILASSVWQEDLATKIVWITMLALKNERHEVEASLPGLAKMAGVTMAECEAAIKKFESPDKYSRNQENGGRKVERCQSGWRVLNGDYYAHLLSADERREYQREYQREYRRRGRITIPKGESIQEHIRRAVNEDPITKSDQATMRKKWGPKKKNNGAIPMASATMAAEYDLGDAGDEAPLIHPLLPPVPSPDALPVPQG